MKNAVLNAEEARELFEYEPSTGRIFWKVSRSNKIRVGQEAGSARADGRVRVGVGTKSYLRARLAWLIHTGSWPRHDIDHIDGDKGNDALHNLRDIKHSVNMQNLRKATKAKRLSSLLGTTFRSDLKSKPWAAKITVEINKVKTIGYFATEEQAHAAYVDAKRRLHEGCTL